MDLRLRPSFPAAVDVVLGVRNGGERCCAITETSVRRGEHSKEERLKQTSTSGAACSDTVANLGETTLITRLGNQSRAEQAIADCRVEGETMMRIELQRLLREVAPASGI